jgi:arginyl-tRNA synthetase
MKQRVEQAIGSAIESLIEQQVLSADAKDRIHVERARDRQHGDFASNIAMVLAKPAKMNPRELATKLVDLIPLLEGIEKVSIAGPGFINFTLAKNAQTAVIDLVRTAGAGYGRSSIGANEKIMIEFVSANPTGPLHVGHGRGAAYGDALKRLLKTCGYDAHAEYYVNDAGRQMQILAASVYLRYLDLLGESVNLPANGYKGDYIWEIAETLKAQQGEQYRLDSAALFKDLPDDVEQSIDKLIERIRTGLGEEGYEVVFGAGLESLVDNIRTDLSEFGVDFDLWFSERDLVDGGMINQAVELLKANGKLYQKDGAWWFKSTDYGDEKDRVVLRANGVHTYFAADIAYSLDKLQRGFEKLVYIWGADHHGYVSRVKAAFDASGKDPALMHMLLVQFAVLYRGEEKVSMSTRGGDFVTLRELREDVGKDAARFFYAMRKPEQHMDFDLELAKSQSSDNPVYYVQYSHARVCSVYRQLEEKGLQPGLDADYELLTEQHEQDLMMELGRYPEVVEKAARDYAPHQIAYYVRDLATAFHTYYNAHPFISSEEPVRNARLALIDAVRIVIANGLDILGVDAPETM